MFNKLKDKLNNFKQSIGKTIDEKAVDLEEPIVESVEGPIEETTEAPIEETMVEEVTEVAEEVPAEPVKVAAEPSTQGQSDVPETQSEKKASFKQKIGFAQKAKALVFEREVILDEDDISDALWELEMALLESDIAITVAEAIVEAVKEELVGSRKKIGSNTGELVEQALRNAIYNVMAANVFDLDEYIEKADKPVHIVFIGINGTGKTTTISKMAKRLKDMNYSVVIAAGDTFRAGAIDQIAIHAERIGVKLIKHQEGGDPAAVVYDAVQHAKANNADVILSDTAGRMHTNVNLMAQLEKVCRVSTPDLIIFVDEAVAGNDAVERAEQFNGAVPIDGSILTKTDADSKGGAAISIAYITGKPILFLGMGQGYDDLQKFDPKWFVDQLFE
ncbi:signal recognition particle-docking protein FtsY [Methanococcoides methylutens]|uniref:Signal recognition particle receptor FtsY n=1 Tax=Methanococcoides methylutens MM1 TaxID=1434104 RepID=A0A0E3X000_METMT|nr:signal recognition particle-docking protein FtsY [Methanococcoides methylutens]AKB84754.1 Signal recognition particle 54 kDa protein [Methanococcoides methylutens MM1]